MKLSSGPLQGFTDDIFRFVHHSVYGGIDEYFGPYIRLENHKVPKSSQVRDIESRLNKSIQFVPQILSKDPGLIIGQIKEFRETGFEKANWNLGCPYPMVTKRGMGSGLLNQPDLVKTILNRVFDETKIKLSIKCRLGLENEDEIFKLIGIFNDFEFEEIIIHARTAKQMYKDYATPKKIIPIIKESKHPIAYNGDINTKDNIDHLSDLFENKVHHFMIGRGLISNPGLANEIRGIKNNNAHFKKFHDTLIENYLERYQEHQLLKRMQAFWEYFELRFPNNKKELKRIKKAKKWEHFVETSNQLINSKS